MSTWIVSLGARGRGQHFGKILLVFLTVMSATTSVVDAGDPEAGPVSGGADLPEPAGPDPEDEREPDLPGTPGDRPPEGTAPDVPRSESVGPALVDAGGLERRSANGESTPVEDRVPIEVDLAPGLAADVTSFGVRLSIGDGSVLRSAGVAVPDRVSDEARLLLSPVSPAKMSELGLEPVLFEIANLSVRSEPVIVRAEIDYSALMVDRSLDWAHRLGFVRFEDCPPSAIDKATGADAVLPEVAKCTGESLAVNNDVGALVLTARIRRRGRTRRTRCAGGRRRRGRAGTDVADQ